MTRGQIESYDLGQKSLADEISELEGDENVMPCLGLKGTNGITDGAKEHAAGGSVASKQDKQ